MPVFEHSSLNLLYSGSFSKCLDKGWSTDKARKEKPNNVSGRVVKHFILLTGKSPSILKSISQPYDLPIQLVCIVFTLLGHSDKSFKPSSNSSENLEILKNH